MTDCRVTSLSLCVRGPVLIWMSFTHSPARGDGVAEEAGQEALLLAWEQ